MCKVVYKKKNIKEQKTELNKKDIYENVRKDINRRQAVHSKAPTTGAELPKCQTEEKKGVSQI